MKNQTHIIGALAALALLLLTTGCSTLGSLYGREVVQVKPPREETIEVLTTNHVTVAEAKTNATTGEVTGPIVQPVVTKSIKTITLPAVYQTNLVERTVVSGAIDATGALPFPFAGVVPIALGWAYSAYASFRNKKSATAVIAGIDAARRFLRETPEGQKLDAKIKEKLIEHQQAAGVVNEVTKLVKEYTGETTRQTA